MSERTLPSQARLVIIGAGIAGCSAAYQLSKLGWRDIVVVDKGPLPYNDGSTSHAPGGMHIVNPSRMMTRFAVESVAIYEDLPDYEEGNPMVRRVGGLELAHTPARWADLKRKHGIASSFGVETSLLDPVETQRRVPILNPDALQGSYASPLDTNVIGWHVAGSLAREATRISGARFIQNCAVTDVVSQAGQVTGVVTEMGTIQTETVLLCANIWAPPIGEKAGLKIPLLAAQHQYTITEPIPELAEYGPDETNQEIVHPIMRHQDYSLYYRQHWDRYGIGNYRHTPLMVDPKTLGRKAMKPFTPEDFEVARKATDEMMPALAGAPLATSFNGMFAFTVDGYPVIGESQLNGFWVAVGIWITHAGGVGKAVAEWMNYGEAGMDVHEADINRFLPFQNTRKFVELRCAQNYREVYDIIHPAQPYDAPRNVRLTPVHPRLEALGGHFVPSAGFEMAQWYGENSRLLEKYEDEIPERSGWEAQFWSPIQGAEHLETRNNVALFNITALSVIEVVGSGAVEFLNRIAANQMDRPVGKVIYTSLLTPRGGIKADLTVVRKAEDRYWILTGGGLVPHDLEWIKRHAPADGSVDVRNLASTYTPLGLWGPNARRVMQKVTDDDVSNEAFPYYTAQEIEVGAIPVSALRISYAGELGWELYTRSESTLALWDQLWEAGREFDMIAAGSGAFDSLRLEKGYRLWGQDIHPDYNPYEAGIGWAVRLKKGDFIGRDALLKAREKGIEKKLSCLTFDDPGAMALGKEPIYVNGDVVGYVTSANYGYSIGKHILYGYLPADLSQPGTRVQVEYFGRRYAATVCSEPLFDPEMKLIRR